MNGFSFVKNSRKYYDDAAQVLTEIMLTRCRPQYHASLSTRAPILSRKNKKKIAQNALQKTENNAAHSQNAQRRGSKQGPNLGLELTASNLAAATGGTGANSTVGGTNGSGGSVNGKLPPRPGSPHVKDALSQSQFGTSGIPDKGPSLARRNSQTNFIAGSECGESTEELRCIIAITRHADRTPKQKMKIKIALPTLLDFFHSYAKSPKKDLKVKSKSALIRFLKITSEILDSGKVNEDDGELYVKLNLIRDVLMRWEISGINRKLQMKPISWETVTSEEDLSGISGATATASKGFLGGVFNSSGGDTDEKEKQVEKEKKKGPNSVPARGE